MPNVPRQSKISAEIIGQCRATPDWQSTEPLTPTSNFARVGIDDHRKRAITERLAHAYAVNVDIDGKDTTAFHRARCINELAEFLLNRIVETLTPTTELELLFRRRQDRSQEEVA